MTDVTAADYIHLIQVELARLGDVQAEHLHLAVPHIEGWKVHDVVGHTGWVARYATLCLQSEPDSLPGRGMIDESPAGPEVLTWFDEGRRLLSERIEAIDPTELRPTWTGPQPALWWLRRLAQEASMHRWDTEAAIGSPHAIDSALALDGIDEVFQVFAPSRLQFDVLGSVGSTMHLHATDIDGGEWTVTIGDGELSWERSHEKGDVAAKGPVSDLLLMLWSRIPPSRLQVFGDVELLGRWQDSAAF